MLKIVVRCRSGQTKDYTHYLPATLLNIHNQSARARMNGWVDVWIRIMCKNRFAFFFCGLLFRRAGTRNKPTRRADLIYLMEHLKLLFAIFPYRPETLLICRYKLVLTLPNSVKPLNSGLLSLSTVQLSAL